MTVGQWFERSKDELAPQEAQFDWRVAYEVRFLMLGWKDLADQFLAATAQPYNRARITADERLLRVPGIKTLVKV